MARLWWGDNYMDLPLNNLATSNTSLYSKLELCKRAFRIVGFSLFYYITFFLMLIGLWKLRKNMGILGSICSAYYFSLWNALCFIWRNEIPLFLCANYDSICNYRANVI